MLGRYKQAWDDCLSDFRGAGVVLGGIGVFYQRYGPEYCDEERGGSWGYLDNCRQHVWTNLPWVGGLFWWGRKLPLEVGFRMQTILKINIFLSMKKKNTT